MSLIQALEAIVGRRHVRRGEAATLRYRTGFRFGGGPALAVVLPGNLVEQWRVFQACAAAGVAIVAQAANTGLTGGSTPDGADYDRDVVIINTGRMARLHLIDGGRQVICLPGATLDQLEKALAPLGREPHSVIGSTCLGASVIGGVCNNSGGSLVQRGPAYTEMALFGRISADGSVSLVNRLGVDLGPDPETILTRLEAGDFNDDDIAPGQTAAGCDHNYADHVRDVNADTPARFNADPRRLFEASGCAGKLLVFAVRLDTFPKAGRQQVFYIGTNDTAVLTQIRRGMLACCKNLPVAAEYLHREAFDIAVTYGKDTFLAVQHLGAARLPRLFSIKSRMDGLARMTWGLPSNATDRLLVAVAKLFPQHLPARIRAFRDRFEHHLLLKMADDGIEEARAFLATLPPSDQSDIFECTPQEGDQAFLHRFAAAGAAVRYRAVHQNQVEDIVALDIALKRNDEDWLEHLPDDLTETIVHKLYYGHFFCHVFHQDYILRKGVDPSAVEHRMWGLLDARGAEYPAEHNVGHLYDAKPQLIEFYRSLDPSNAMNPGIGRSTKYLNWRQPS